MPSGPVEVGDALLARLREICEEVDTDPYSRADEGRDWWPLSMTWALSGQVPAMAAAIARPASTKQVAAVLRCCAEEGVPVTPTAGRSGVCGASVPVFGGVAIDLTRLRGILSVDNESLLLEVLPGTFGDALEQELREAHGLTLGHWPQSIALSTVGGWLACRSAGQYSTRYGKIEDMVAGLEVVLADGTVVRTGGTGPRSATGPDLTQLFVGSEGTLGVITAATLRAHPAPNGEERSAWLFASFDEGLESCRRVVRRGATPAVLRLYDKVESARSFEVADGNLLVVLDEGEPALVGVTLGIVADECSRSGAERADSELVGRWLAHRNDVSGLESLVKRGIVVDTIEIAARWSSLKAIYHDGIEALMAIAGNRATSVHQSHAYTDGACLYFTFAGGPFDSPSAAERFYSRSWDSAMNVTSRHGGSLSHHHGIGINRAKYLPGALGAAFAVLESVKRSLDPGGILNPGKLGFQSAFGPVPWP
jgi:alkyldihydroxyacetonephosphate synthase